jgi:hypothetical protein
MGKKRKLEDRLSPTVRTRAFISEPIDLPPPFTLVRLRESGDAFTHALGIAEQSGAGTLVYVGRFDLAEFAVVLEPNEPLRTARRAFYVGMVALTDALRAYAPPNKSVTIVWPDAICIDGGLVGGGRLGWPPSVKGNEPPPWFARHLMLAVDAWQVDGFDGVAREFLVRLSRDEQVSRRIDENGDLVLHRIGTDKPERRELVKALAAPSWFDPKLGGPRM